jgi:hypothetical protein
MVVNLLCYASQLSLLVTIRYLIQKGRYNLEEESGATTTTTTTALYYSNRGTGNT